MILDPIRYLQYTNWVIGLFVILLATAFTGERSVLLDASDGYALLVFNWVFYSQIAIAYFLSKKPIIVLILFACGAFYILYVFSGVDQIKHIFNNGIRSLIIKQGGIALIPLFGVCLVANLVAGVLAVTGMHAKQGE